MKKSDKVINIIGLIILIATIITFNFIIGANEKGLRVLPISILMGFICVYLVVLKIKNRKESIFFKSKVDYLVLAFMLTTVLPLLFRTYVSFSDTIEFMMKYFFIYSVYLLARNVIKDKKSIEIIITVTLISSLIPIILGFDYDNTKILRGFTKWLNIHYSPENAFHGTFGYANTQAVYCVLCVLLTMHKFKIHKNKFLKVIDIIFILFNLFVIYKTESRAILILLGITLFALFIAKFRKQIVKHKKKILIGLGSVLCLVTTFLIIALNTSKPVIKNNEDIDKKIVYNFKQNETYTLELNMKTEDTEDSISDIKDVFEIELVQCGPYFKESTIAKAISGKVEDCYSIDFTPTQNTKYIKVKIKNLFHGKITINDFFINGERQIVEYKYLPNDTGHFLSKFYIGGKSLPQRFYMYQDSLKIASDSPIVGNGGDAWKNVSRAVEDYKIAMKECHSYFFELLISYGIVGVLAFLTLTICFFVKIFKQCRKDKDKRKEKLLIVLGLLITLLHTIIDFDMSFMVIQLLVYIYMAVLLYDEQKTFKQNDVIINNIKDYALIVFLVFILSLFIKTNISEYLIQDKIEKHNITPHKKTYYYDKLKKDIENTNEPIYLLNEINLFMDKEVYYYSSTSNYRTYFRTIINNLDEISEEDLQYYLDIGIKRLKTVRFRTPMEYSAVIERAQMLADVVNDYKNCETTIQKTDIIKKAVEEIKDVLYNEYEINIKNIKDYEKTGLNAKSIKETLEKYQNIYNLVNKE